MRNDTLAADPVIGSWKLNIARSKFSPILLAAQRLAAPNERTEDYREIEAHQIELTTAEIRTDGSTGGGKFVWPAQGGSVRLVSGDAHGVSYVQTLIEPGEWYVTVLLNGTQVSVMHKVFSKDGGTMFQTSTGVGPHGERYENLRVFDRQ